MYKKTSSMKRFLLFCLLLAGSYGFSQKNYLVETKEEKDSRMQWWRDAGFGMFIHWGVYSVPAGEYKGQEVKGIGEWIMETAKIPIPEYEQYARQFNPQKFNAKEWVRIAKESGVKYIVITSKHHDGFSLWNSKVANYDIMDFAPFKRDILGELTSACKEAGIRMCFYHSILDWHQPDAKSEKYPHQSTAQPVFSRYREEYLKPQLKELLTNYDPAVLWFDGEWIPEWTEEQGKSLYNYLRNMKPDLLINNRIGKGRAGMQGMNQYKDAAGDFGTPEQEILEGTSDYDWESCMTMNDTWGFKKNDHNWKSSTILIHNLVDVAAKGGNYLLNIGPTAQGEIPQPSVERLLEMGKWLKINGEAIYATNSLKNYKEGDNIKFTVNKDGKHIYAIVTKMEGNDVRIKNIRPISGSQIYMLGIKEALKWKTDNDATVVTFPGTLPCEHAWVLKVEGSAKN
jgi:alpha-L-fucosidase